MRIMKPMTHKKVLVNEIHIGPNSPAELLKCYDRMSAVFDDVVEAEIKIRADLK